MNLTTETKNGVIVLSPRGHIDHQSGGEFGQALLSRVGGPRGNTQVVVNFAGVDYINSEGLQVVLLVRKRMAGTKGTLVLCEMKAHIREVFKISGFDQIVTIVDTEADALKRLHRQPSDGRWASGS